MPRAVARHLALEGYCVLLDALDSGRLEALQETAASLIKRSVQDWANRGTQRFSFGITTDIGCLAAVDSTAVVNTLQELWECTSDAFTVLLPHSSSSRNHPCTRARCEFNLWSDGKLKSQS